MSTPLSEARPSAPSWMVWAALWIVYIVWGSTYLAIRVAVETMPPLLMAGVRFLIAGAVIFLWLRIRKGKGAGRVSLSEALWATLIGGGLIMGGNGLVTLAERDVPSGLAALIVASVPLWVVVLRFIFRERVRLGTLVSVVVGFVGVALLVVRAARGFPALFANSPEDVTLANVAHRLGPRIIRSDRLTRDTNEQLAAYLEGDLDDFERPVDLSLVHAPFRKIVLQHLQEIPRGQVVTYGELAKRAGKPRAARAAGSSCATNPIPIIVPCHRVVPGSGGVGNYGGGPDRKWFLLGLEGAPVASQRGEHGRT